MKLILTPEQQAAIAPHIRHGWTLIAKLSARCSPARMPAHRDSYGLSLARCRLAAFPHSARLSRRRRHPRHRHRRNPNERANNETKETRRRRRAAIQRCTQRRLCRAGNDRHHAGLGSQDETSSPSSQTTEEEAMSTHRCIAIAEQSKPRGGHPARTAGRTGTPPPHPNMKATRTG